MWLINSQLLTLNSQLLTLNSQLFHHSHRSPVEGLDGADCWTKTAGAEEAAGRREAARLTAVISEPVTVT